MIIETNTKLFQNIRYNWLNRVRESDIFQRVAYQDLKYEFFDWLKDQGATINRSRRKLSASTLPFAYDETTIIPGTDYIEFANEYNYSIFILKYA